MSGEYVREIDDYSLWIGEGVFGAGYRVKRGSYVVANLFGGGMSIGEAARRAVAAVEKNRNNPCGIGACVKVDGRYGVVVSRGTNRHGVARVSVLFDEVAGGVGYNESEVNPVGTAIDVKSE